jgi:hypothetical protein
VLGEIARGLEDLGGHPAGTEARPRGSLGLPGLHDAGGGWMRDRDDKPIGSLLREKRRPRDAERHDWIRTLIMGEELRSLEGDVPRLDRIAQTLSPEGAGDQTQNLRGTRQAAREPRRDRKNRLPLDLEPASPAVPAAAQE